MLLPVHFEVRCLQCRSTYCRNCNGAITEQAQTANLQLTELTAYWNRESQSWGIDASQSRIPEHPPWNEQSGCHSLVGAPAASQSPHLAPPSGNGESTSPGTPGRRGGLTRSASRIAGMARRTARLAVFRRRGGSDPPQYTPVAPSASSILVPTTGRSSNAGENTRTTPTARPPLSVEVNASSQRPRRTVQVEDPPATTRTADVPSITATSGPTSTNTRRNRRVPPGGIFLPPPNPAGPSAVGARNTPMITENSRIVDESSPASIFPGPLYGYYGRPFPLHNIAQTAQHPVFSTPTPGQNNNRGMDESRAQERGASSSAWDERHRNITPIHIRDANAQRLAFDPTSTLPQWARNYQMINELRDIEMTRPEQYQVGQDFTTAHHHRHSISSMPGASTALAMDDDATFLNQMTPNRNPNSWMVRQQIESEERIRSPNLELNAAFTGSNTATMTGHGILPDAYGPLYATVEYID